jgi:hypothetical protein
MGTPRIERPSWRVPVATDDARVLELTANGELGQLYISFGDTSRPPEHVATFNNLIDALIEAKDHLDAASSPLAEAAANTEPTL